MTTTILQIIQDAAAELGLAAPTAAVTATDLQSLQLLALANRCGNILLQQWDWSQLTQLFVVNMYQPPTSTGDTTANSVTITGVADTSGITGMATNYSITGEGIQQGARITAITSNTITMNVPANATATASSLTFSQDTYALPADWNNPTKRTQWDRTNHWEVQGAISPQQYQWLVSGITATGPRRKYRIQGNNVVFWPPPSSEDTPDTLTMEYESAYWIQSSTGVAKPRFTADTDMTVYPPDCMVMGLKWLFFQVKGFEYTELRRQWDNQVSMYAATNQGAQTLDMTGRSWPTFITPANVQDANFPS